MDNRSRGFRAAAAVVMLVFLLAVSAFALAEADPIRVSSLSEPQSVISEQDVSITIKVYNSSQTDMTEQIALYDPNGDLVSTYNGLQGEQSVTYTGTWHVTQEQIQEGKIKYYIQYNIDSGNGSDKVVRAVPVTIQTEAARAAADGDLYRHADQRAQGAESQRGVYPFQHGQHRAAQHRRQQRGHQR